MTPTEKATQTRREKAEREREKRAAARRDREQAIVICRAIRDNEDSAAADRLEAIKLLREYTTS